MHQSKASTLLVVLSIGFIINQIYWTSHFSILINEYDSTAIHPSRQYGRENESINPILTSSISDVDRSYALNSASSSKIIEPNVKQNTHLLGGSSSTASDHHDRSQHVNKKNFRDNDFLAISQPSNISLNEEWLNKLVRDHFQFDIDSTNNNNDAYNKIKGSLHKYFDRSNRVILPDTNRTSFSFIHIGKTGGSTISSMLRNGCHEFLPKPCPGRLNTIENESAASLRIQHYYHVCNITYSKNNSTSYVIMVRNPVHRAASAFLYHHPKNLQALLLQQQQENQLVDFGLSSSSNNNNDISKSKGRKRQTFYEPNVHNNFLYSCFPSLRFFALYVAKQMLPETVKARPIDNKKSFSLKDLQTLNCTDIARKALLGQEPQMQHLYWNYKAYVGSMPSSAEVFVIRQEHLWEDWYEFNHLLEKQLNDGVTETVSTNVRQQQHHHLRSTKDLPVKNDLREHEIRIMCKYLREEIQLYVSLLNRAVNLSNEDVVESLSDLYKTCPHEMAQ